METFEGFAEFMRVHRGRLSRIAYLLTGNDQAAADLLQSALTKTAARWRHVLRGGRPEWYVRRAMYNECISSWRRRSVIAEYPTSDVPDPPAARAHGWGHADDAVRRVVFVRALAKLTPRQRAVLVLRFYEDLGIVETAHVLGCSEGNVKSQTRRALDRLRALAPELSEFITDPRERVWK